MFLRMLQIRINHKRCGNVPLSFFLRMGITKPPDVSSGLTFSVLHAIIVLSMGEIGGDSMTDKEKIAHDFALVALRICYDAAPDEFSETVHGEKIVSPEKLYEQYTQLVNMVERDFMPHERP